MKKQLTLVKEKKNVSLTPVVSLLTQLSHEELFTKFSSWNKLQRVTAYCLRFIHNCRCKYAHCQGTSSLAEMNEATLLCMKTAQTDSSMKQKADLLEKGSLSNKSSLLSLNPFLDRNQLLRVGGRLENSDLMFAQQHPMILTKGHHITTLIVEDIHKKNLHASGQLLSLIRQKVWIPDARNVLRKITQKCLTCLTKLMGQLPEAQVKTSKPFTNSGVGYSGSFYVKQGGKQSRTAAKFCVALFVCLSTEAVHLELVSELSTEAYLAFPRRFTVRRGLRTNSYSDNGANFVRAEKELKTIVSEKESTEHISSFVTQQGINFHFIPPCTPHVGGIWEAGVKLMKFKLHTVVGNAKLTSEESYTLLCQVEAVLNSRSLCPLSNDSDNLQFLTPGLFLISTSLLALPDHSLIDLSSNRLSRW